MEPSSFTGVLLYGYSLNVVVYSVYRWRDPGVDGRIILGWTFRRWDVGVWTGLGWLRIGTGGGRL
jgi:hypothetical protein